MILRQSHTTVYVLNQEEALCFYRDKLGFEVRNDMTMDNGFRWLTVGPKTQPDLEIILMEAREELREPIRKGMVGAGVLETSDCHGTYATLKAKGVEFASPPTERFYGIEAVIKDNSGNWFSLTQRKK